MILPAAIALGAQLVVPAADQVPVFNVDTVCIGIARQAANSPTDPAVDKQKKECVQSEQQVRDQLVKQWSNFPASDKRSCINEARMGGDSSYTELLTCLEMARDVRTLHNENADVPGVTRKRRR
jgi:hypothetical protein